MLTEKKKEFIEFMLSAQVLRFGHFVTKSGRNTQYFVNTGNYKTGAQLSRLGSYYAGLVKDTVGGEFEAMFGRPIRASPWPAPAPSPCTTTTASTSPISSTAKR